MDNDDEIPCPQCDYIYGPFELAAIAASPNLEGKFPCGGCEKILKIETRSTYKLRSAK